VEANVRPMPNRRMLLLLDVLCLAGVLWAGMLIGLLLAGRQTFSTTVAVGVAALLVLPGFLAGVVANRTTFRGRPPRDAGQPTIWRPPVDLPHAALAMAGVAFLAFWVLGMTGFAVLDRDSPDPAAEQRIALGVLGGLGVAGTTIAAAAYRQSRTPRPDPVASRR
jgi:hypothetical protein